MFFCSSRDAHTNNVIQRLLRHIPYLLGLIPVLTTCSELGSGLCTCRSFSFYALITPYFRPDATRLGSYKRVRPLAPPVLFPDLSNPNVMRFVSTCLYWEEMMTSSTFSANALTYSQCWGYKLRISWLECEIGQAFLCQRTSYAPQLCLYYLNSHSRLGDPMAWGDGVCRDPENPQ